MISQPFLASARRGEAELRSRVGVTTTERVRLGVVRRIERQCKMCARFCAAKREVELLRRLLHARQVRSSSKGRRP